MMKTPFSIRISSASGVVGPLAPSARMRACTEGAFSAVIWFSRAAGMSTSTFSVSSSALEIGSPLGNPTTVRFRRTCSISRGMSSPFGW